MIILMLIIIGLIYFYLGDDFKVAVCVMLFITSVSFGQKGSFHIPDSLYDFYISEDDPLWQTTELFYYFGEEKATVVVGKDTAKNAPGPYQTMVILTWIQQLELYEAECYADSVCSVDSGYVLDTRCPDSIRLIEIPGSRRCYHTEPTFKNFIKFLKRRVE